MTRLHSSPFCLSAPQPGDFCCLPIPGTAGLGIEVGEFLAARLQGFPASLKPYDHAEVYVGQADATGPHGYTYSAYPSNGKAGHTGKRPLPCPPDQLPGSVWSSGLYVLTPAQRAGIVAWCEEHSDVEYSWLDYQAIALHALGLSWPGLREFIADGGRMICSYYCDAAWTANGLHLFSDGRWPGYVTPYDLADLLLGKAFAVE